ncbi:porin family protein [Alsobacter sp. SYSU M60028]|uniref:Porin family protein n=1 Tax=Alsobacter ponti TaxID=2962936 RepID=A0ABT1LF78_9HYPH|nr:outer membrane protein [Alsobacter ponti]MCP8940099.1 porin family protein [Alsobacter ponti]
MRRILLASVMSLAALPAFAADLPVRTAPVAPAPVYAPLYNWTGFYIGANAGYAWGNSDVVDLALGTKYSLDPGGFTAGLQAGYNYQVNQFVLGVEADANWIDASDSYSDGFVYASSKVSWLSTIRARVGYAFNNVLIYATGGIAFGEAKATWYDGGAISIRDSDTRTGWALGAGVEYAFNRNWTAKLEYLYYDLGDSSFYGSAPVVGPALLPVGTTTGAKADWSGNIVRAGINYKF